MNDSHCHLTDHRLGADVANVLHRAAAAGVRQVVTIATTPEDAALARSIADTHAAVVFAAGIHPNNSGPYAVADVERLREFASHPKCVALGEMGLDFYWKDVAPTHQESIFRAQLALALDLGKPVVIHSRQAIPETLAVMQDFDGIRGVFHCFTGTPVEARAILDAGFLLGFTGPLTYKKNDELRKIAAEAPEDRILIETDAPYLSPEPHRGKLNEPAFVRLVLETLAKVRGLSRDEADALTSANTRRLFGID